MVSKLIDFVARAMAIAQLTHLYLTIPTSGSMVGKVPEECFPSVSLTRGSVLPRRVSFTDMVPVIDSTPWSSPTRGLESLGDHVMEGPELQG